MEVLSAPLENLWHYDNVLPNLIHFISLPLLRESVLRYCVHASALIKRNPAFIRQG